MRFSACVAYNIIIILTVTVSSAASEDARLGVGVMYPRRVNACGKEIFAIRGQFQAVTGGWELQVLYELYPPPANTTYYW